MALHYLWLFIAVICFSVQLTAVKEYNHRFSKGKATLFQFQALHLYVASGLTLIVCLAGGGFGPLLPATLWYGLLFGAVFIWFFFFYTMAIDTGPMSFTTLCNSSANIFPVLIGLLFWGETLSPLQYCGIALVLVMFYLGSGIGTNTGENRKASGSWLIYVALMMVCSGTLMTLTKLHPMLTGGLQVPEFYTIGLGTAATIALILSLIFHKGKGEAVNRLGPRLVGTCAIAGVGTCAGNQLMGLVASQGVNASIMFPFVNGAQVVFITLISTLVYRERLTRRTLIALGIGIVALVLISV